jgi:hypothetical protein
MRAVLILLAVGIAGPAVVQPYLGLEQSRDAQAVTDALAARARDVTLTNDLAVLQSRVQSDQALSNLQGSRSSPTVPTIPFNPDAPPPTIDASKLATIPDATLAQSNARVRAAADNRR